MALAESNEASDAFKPTKVTLMEDNNKLRFHGVEQSKQALTCVFLFSYKVMKLVNWT